jgi:Caspase domain
MKPKGFLVGVIALAAALLCGSAAEAERRVAFVIGNSAYKNATSLPNTINDANAVAALFRSVGFEVVTSRTDLGVLDFKRAVRDFLITAETADIAVVYYAGHGIEVGGTNYLIPVDAKLARDYDVEDEAVALDRIIWALQSVKRLRLILLDACRDNPFVTKLQRSVGVRAAAKGGLAKIDDVSADTLVAYAAKAGSVSYDGDGANSPFATALLRHIAEPGIDIRIALGRVRDEVLKLTAGRQEPFIYGSLGGATIPLVPQPPAKAITPAPMPPPPVAAREPATRPAATVAPAEPNRVEKPAPTTAKAPPAKAEPAPPPQKSQAVLEPPPKPQAALDPALACGRDEQRLARLRSDPVADEVARLQRELSCDKLRPQVQRLFESIATVPPTPAPVAAAPAGNAVRKSEPPADPAAGAQAKAAPISPEMACARDSERLARLRAEPTIDAIARFEKELGCEHIRPQLRRLRESVGQ